MAKNDDNKYPPLLFVATISDRYNFVEKLKTIEKQTLFVAIIFNWDNVRVYEAQNTHKNTIT
jgi:hypothetical protein